MKQLRRSHAARALRAARPARAAAAARRALRVRRVEEGAASISTTTSSVDEALLLGAVRARARRASWARADRDDGRDLPPRRARRLARAQPRARRHTTEPGAHARGRTGAHAAGVDAHARRGRATVGTDDGRDGAAISSTRTRVPSRAGARAVDLLRLGEKLRPRAHSRPRAPARFALGARSYRPVANHPRRSAATACRCPATSPSDAPAIDARERPRA